MLLAVMRHVWASRGETQPKANSLDPTLKVKDLVSGAAYRLRYAKRYKALAEFRQCEAGKAGVVVGNAPPQSRPDRRTDKNSSKKQIPISHRLIAGITKTNWRGTSSFGRLHRHQLRPACEVVFDGAPIPEIDLERYSSALRKDKENMGTQLGLIVTRGIGDIFKQLCDFDDGITRYFERKLI